VIHGEPAGSEALAKALEESLGWQAVLPAYGENVRLD
jgi:hypothetical protein